MLALALGAGTASLTLAVWAGRTLPGHRAQQAAALVEIRGQLRSINFERQRVTVSGAGSSVQLKVTGATTIFSHGRLGELSDLAEGQSVRASYEPGARAPEALWIELLP